MNKDRYVFSQVTDFLDRNHFNYLVRKYGGDKYVKEFTCWNQLLVLMFGQLSNRESLRDLIVAIEAHQNKMHHLGFGKHVTRSNLAKANTKRPYQIFEDFAYHLVAEAQRRDITHIFNLGGNTYAFDSTTIELCLETFKWATFRRNQGKGGIKVHTLFDIETQIPTFFHITTANVNDMNAMDVLIYEVGSFYIFDRGYNDFSRLFKIHVIGAYFVIRAKKNLLFKAMSWKRRLPENVLSDSIGYLDGAKAPYDYPDKIRRVVYWDSEQKRKFTFLTNALDINALEVANLYKNRWKIELFFKWMKQHLKIKKFWGETENAVRIQIYTAISTYCLVAILQSRMKLERSIYEILQILSISLTDKTHLVDLFNKTNINIDNELNGSSEPTLF